MIRFARQTDLEHVIALWKQCFPGDDAFRNWFFQTVYDPAITLLDEEEGTICAMLQMLPYQLRDARGVRPVTYIYGACTAPAYRRQHRMDRLLQHSFALDQTEGRAASILIPQEEWLFGFYDLFGYQTAFYLDTVTRTRDNQPVSGTIHTLREADIPAMRALYESSSQVCLLRSTRDWSNQLAMFDRLGLGAYGLVQNGVLEAYAFVWDDGDGKLWAQECCGAAADMLAQSILQQCQADEIRMTRPGRSQKLGCIRYYDDTPVQPGYFNLLFN
ncbi:MAG: GNAT family N-acetyltransferase [Eubacteriales bacterium]|nr:GNAT family N-acetyltransferase [Eubacteriales bacterium]